jgi:hypothetical protein
MNIGAMLERARACVMVMLSQYPLLPMLNPEIELGVELKSLSSSTVWLRERPSGYEMIMIMHVTCTNDKLAEQ